MDGCVAGSTPATSDRRLTSDLDARRAHRREEAALNTLSPREIQSRLRSGATVAELAEESGMDSSAIERFSGPPLAERAWVSEQARLCVVRPGTEDLETLVQRDVRGKGDAALVWDAWRRPDGRWTVVAAIGDDSPVSTWLYDPRSRSIQPDDAASLRLASEDVVVPLRSSTSTVSLPREEAPQSAPAVEKTTEPDASETSATPAAGDSDAPSQDTEPSEPTPVPSEATRAKSRKGRRASVPRWDEILFGAGQSDA
ncbi:MAG: septation protein SepH [Candidatus Nanopelagicales bacterium]